MTLRTVVYRPYFLGGDWTEERFGTGRLEFERQPPGTIIGGDSALDVDDGDTSHVYLQGRGLTVPHNGTVVTFRLTQESEGGPPPNPSSAVGVLWTATYRSIGATSSGNAAVIVYGVTPTGSTSTSGDQFLQVNPSYAETDSALVYNSILDWYNTATIAAADEPWALVVRSETNPDDSQAWVTRLRCAITFETAPATPPPLRQKQRDDGLGRSNVRARGGTSVQHSIRQRGYR